MRKLFMIIITLFLSFAFAEEQNVISLTEISSVNKQEEESTKETIKSFKDTKNYSSYWTTFVQTGTWVMPVTSKEFIAGPLVSGGWQFIEGKNGVDISAAIGGARYEKSSGFAYHIPKISYLRFVSDNFYYGFGASLYGIHSYSKKITEFNGSAPSYYRKNMTSYNGLAINPQIGYNVKLGKTLRSCFVFNANIPTPAMITKPTGNVYMPSIELKAGLGF
ncbi:MAG: hypothetical protein A3F40_01255 [Chlamydiae bacterium RIFCSPHIGHO2_12_FULL_27_8]|nr:MAG: hypothetical protein A3F40_01255 [Chlamydiae bacterium RIFCSPHIGHO2_12_FULL_27_8]OGN65531.1 MAG: hypothetical protein A2888_00685 [Chlamydiae bacterium RIFCSPLOWO2_01_FULL_28_7]